MNSRGKDKVRDMKWKLLLRVLDEIVIFIIDVMNHDSPTSRSVHEAMTKLREEVNEEERPVT